MDAIEMRFSASRKILHKFFWVLLQKFLFGAEKLNFSWIRIWKTFPSYPKYFPNGKQAANFFNKLQQVWLQHLKKKKRNTKGHLSNTNDNGNNDEKNVYKHGWEYSGWESSGWEFSGGNSLGENLMGGSFPGVNFPVGNFPDTISIVRK